MCLQSSPKSVFAERGITEIVWQRVPGSRACNSKCPTAETGAMMSWDDELMATCRAEPLASDSIGFRLAAVDKVLRSIALQTSMSNHFKIATLTYHTLQSGSPSYQSSLINNNIPHRPLFILTLPFACSFYHQGCRLQSIQVYSSYSLELYSTKHQAIIINRLLQTQSQNFSFLFSISHVPHLATPAPVTQACVNLCATQML